MRYYLPSLSEVVPIKFIKAHWDELLALESVVDEDYYAQDVLAGLGRLVMKFRWEFVEGYWDVLYELGWEAGINAGYLYGHGLVRLRPLIFDGIGDDGIPASDVEAGKVEQNLLKYGRDLIRLAESAGLESRWNLFFDSIGPFLGNFEHAYVRAHWDEFVAMAVAARRSGPFLWRWALPGFIQAFSPGYFDEKRGDLMRICAAAQDGAAQLVVRYSELDAEYEEGFVDGHWDGLLALVEAAGVSAGALFETRFVQAVDQPGRLAELLSLLNGWPGNKDNLTLLFSMVKISH